MAGKKSVSYLSLMKMAREYGVDKNELYKAAAKQYERQQKVISMMMSEIETSSATVTKNYNGADNEYTNPLIKELPKHSDSANKTLAAMLNIIETLGRKPEPKPARSKLDELLSE